MNSKRRWFVCPWISWSTCVWINTEIDRFILWSAEKCKINEKWKHFVALFRSNCLLEFPSLPIMKCAQLARKLIEETQENKMNWWFISSSFHATHSSIYKSIRLLSCSFTFQKYSCSRCSHSYNCIWHSCTCLCNDDWNRKAAVSLQFVAHLTAFPSAKERRIDSHSF